MELAAPVKKSRVNHLLPYWAVFQMDMQQTARSWVYRVWVAAAVVLGVGYLLHRAAIHHQAGILQSASSLMSELLQFMLLIGTTLVIVLTSGTISGERGIVADSVLSRGISRYQYFIGKWHSRLVTTLGSFLFVGGLMLGGSCFLLQADVSILGSILALLLIAAIMAFVVSCGVTVSSLCHSTVLAIAILWMAIYGAGIALSFLHLTEFSPPRLLRIIPALLRGEFDLRAQLHLIGYCLLASLAAALVGLVHFARRDV